MCVLVCVFSSTVRLNPISAGALNRQFNALHGGDADFSGITVSVNLSSTFSIKLTGGQFLSHTTETDTEMKWILIET